MNRFSSTCFLFFVGLIAGCANAHDSGVHHGPPDIPSPVSEPTPGDNSSAADSKAVPVGHAPRISIEFVDADIRIVLDLLAKQSGANLVMAEDVSGKISVSLEDLEWLEALEIIVETAGCELVDKSPENNFLRVVTRKE